MSKSLKYDKRTTDAELWSIVRKGEQGESDEAGAEINRRARAAGAKDAKDKSQGGKDKKPEIPCTNFESNCNDRGSVTAKHWRGDTWHSFAPQELLDFLLEQDVMIASAIELCRKDVPDNAVEFRKAGVWIEHSRRGGKLAKPTKGHNIDDTLAGLKKLAETAGVKQEQRDASEAQCDWRVEAPLRQQAKG